MENDFEPPWPEWQDQFVNDTKWSFVGNFIESFCEPYDHGVLPHYLQVTKWRRPSTIYEDENAPWKIGDENERFDLISNNRHLIESKIMRCIITSIMCLEKIGRQNPVDGKNYYPNTPGTFDWKPWHHIYSINKVGKGSRPSSPKFNPLGMYYVRLFYMGKWRRVTVDDYFPYDADDNILIPSTQTKCDLWLPILSKALLRIASQTWTRAEDIIDFSVVSCFTGWVEYNIDCRSTSIDNVWNAIKLNLFPKSKKDKKIDEFCLTCDTITCLTNKDHTGFGDNSNTTVFGVLDKTSLREIKGVSPAMEHLIYFCFAHKQPVGDKEEFPNWKNLRWIDWAVENKVINVKPGFVLRTVGIFSPFAKIIPLHLSKVPGQTADLGGHLFTDSIIGQRNIYDLMLEAQAQVVVSQDTHEPIQDTLEFNFAEIYPYLRELKIYYRNQDFNQSFSISDLETFVDKLSEKPDFLVRAPSISKQSKKSKSVKQPVNETVNKSKINQVDNENETELSDSSLQLETCRFFYLFSDTSFCKNIYFSLSIVREKGVKFGYLICEKYSWKSVAFGPLLLGMRTFGTKTSLLKLGPGMQVCRVFYSLPPKYSLTINSATYFTVVNSEKLHDLLSHYTKPLIFQGDRMLRGFRQLLPLTPNTPDHIQVIGYYKKTFFPPGYKDFTIAFQIKIAQDYDEVFEEAFTKYIFDSSIPMQTKVAYLNDLKVVFNNQEFGEPYIQNLDKRMLKDIKTFKKDLALGIFPNKMIIKLKMMNEVFKENDMELFDLPEVEPKEPNVTDHFEVEQNLLLNPQMHIEVLRNILDKKPQYLQYYPFMNEHYLLLKYKDYEGVTNVTPAHNWFIIARLTLNIHSTKAVPCGIYTITEFPKAVLYVIDTDSCEKLSLPPGLSATFHLKRNKIGYTILLCGYATPDMIAEELSMAWKIRVLGLDIGNILHVCDSVSPYYCEEKEHVQPGLAVKNITGYYLPNTENVIGRFIISIAKSMLGTLYLSVSNEEVEIGLSLKGSNGDKIIEAEGKGSIFVPVVVLDSNFGVWSPNGQDMYQFFGTIHLKGPWILTTTELSFVKVIRSSSKKDIISLGALFNEISPDIEEDNNEIVDEKVEKEKSNRLRSSPILHSKNSSKDMTVKEKNSPAGSSNSYCGYDSSHTETTVSICKSESTSLSKESKETSQTSTTIGTASLGTSTYNSSSTSSDAPTLEKTLSSSSDRSVYQKSYARIVEDPYGLCGAGPHWVLSFIVDHQFEDSALIDNDFIRYEQFQKLKNFWDQKNPQRLEKGERLRKDFLNVYQDNFLKFQLDPENISISDFSEDEKVSDEDHKYYYAFTEKLQSPSALLLSSTPSGSLLNDGSPKSFPYNEDKSKNLYTNPDHLAKSDRKYIKKKKLLKLEGKLSPKNFKSLSLTEAESENQRKLQDSTLYKIIGRTKKKLENILLQDDSSSSSFSGDSKTFKDIKCPPLPIMTNALIKNYSLPFKGRPTLLTHIPEKNGIPPLTEEELREICLKRKVSFRTVYKKLVAPILWSISGCKMPYCLNDLPIQAYSQKRFSDKLEKTLKTIRTNRIKEMGIRESLGAKQTSRKFPLSKQFSA